MSKTLKASLYLLAAVLVVGAASDSKAQVCPDLFRPGQKPTATIAIPEEGSRIGLLGRKLTDRATFRISPEIAVDTDNVEFLFDSVEAFQKRFKALTGEEIPREVIEKSDLTWQPSFRNAPKIDTIVITTLYARYDFTSEFLARALEYHAQRGTKIIFGSSRSIVDIEKLKGLAKGGKFGATVQKDVNFMERLKNIGADVHLLSLRSANPRRFTRGQAYLKAMHAKGLAIYSASNPEISQVFMGGRNVSDSYYLPTAPDLAADGNLLQYNKDYTWMFVTDFDVSIKGPDFARQVIKDLGNLLPQRARTRLKRHMETVVQQERVLPPERRIDHPEDHVSIRNFVSLAGKDLENLYVDAINSAKTSARVLTPYFNPSKRIAKAIRQAAERGVEIEIVTNLTMHGDDFPEAIVKAIESFNNQGAAKVAKHVKFRTWKKQDLFHPKVLEIDKQMLFVTSVNMNARSFTKDVENGMILESRKLVTAFDETVYKAKIEPNTIPVEQLKDIRWYYRLLFLIFGYLF